MNFVDLSIQFQAEVDQVSLSAVLEDETERRLIDLAKAQNNLTGATICITAQEQGPNVSGWFQGDNSTLPSNLLAMKQANTLQGAFGEALEAAQRQVRQVRRNRKEHWKLLDIHDWQTDDLMDMGVLLDEVTIRWYSRKCWGNRKNREKVRTTCEITMNWTKSRNGKSTSTILSIG